LLLSATDPSAQEQELLWLLNRMRTAPAAELPLLLNSSDAAIQDALSFFKVDTTVLAQQWATLSPVQPVAWNTALSTAATGHNVAMAAADQQAHQVPGEPAPGDRFNAAGYNYSVAAENVYAFAQSVIHAHAGFAIDWGNAPEDVGGIQNPPYHRIDMMNGAYRDVGINVLFSNVPGKSTGPFLVTQDFASPAVPADFMLVGTIFQDANGDKAYNAGEGLSGITVTVTGDKGTFTTQSLTQGGYQLALPDGAYTVTFSATGDNAKLIPAANTFSITVNGQNLLQDLMIPSGITNPPPPPPPPPPPSTKPPIGRIDLVQNWPSGAPRTIYGWAFDTDYGSQPIQVRLDVDGVHGQPILAALDRSDLTKVIGSSAHGFGIDVPPLAPGSHTLQLVALDYPSGADTLLATRNVNITATAFGSVDLLSINKGIYGWAFDPALGTSPVTVRLTIDGNPTPAVSASDTRPDLISHFGSADHGFSIAPRLVPFGIHRYDVWAIGAAGKAKLIGSKTEKAVPPLGALDDASTSWIGGWAMDPNSPAAAGSIRIDIDGTTYRTLSTTIPRPGLAPLGSGNFGFELMTPQLSAGNHVISLYAIDDQSGYPIKVAQRLLVVPPSFNRTPIGSLDVLNPAGLVSGWAIDPDAQNDPVQIQFSIDGSVSQTIAADTTRPDLGTFFSSSAHGYSFNLASLLASLTPGPHRIEVFALDLQTSQPILLGSGALDLPLTSALV
jgi:hypothetical protein